MSGSLEDVQIEYGDSLQTVAEVSVAFAGFTGVVSVFQGLQSAVAPRARVFRIRAMLLTSLSAMLFSLIPILLSHYGLSEGVMWRIACLAFAAAFGALSLYVYREVLPLNRQGMLHRTAYGNFFATCSWVLSASLFAFLVACGVGALPGLAFAIYFSGLFYLLFLSSYNFVLLILALQPSE